jgi:hypothetical protein
MTLAIAWDTVLALALVAVALAWIVRRAVRTLSRRGGSACACPSASPGGACDAAGRTSDLRAAAARGAAKAAARPGTPPSA